MLYDGFDCVADYDNNTTLQRYYITPGLDENMIVNVASGGNPDTDYFYAQDGLGTVRQILDASQTMMNQYDYEGFGTSVSQTETIYNRFRFACGEIDAETQSANSKPLYFDITGFYDSSSGVLFCDLGALKKSEKLRKELNEQEKKLQRAISALVHYWDYDKVNKNRDSKLLKTIKDLIPKVDELKKKLGINTMAGCTLKIRITLPTGFKTTKDTWGHAFFSLDMFSYNSDGEKEIENILTKGLYIRGEDNNRRDALANALGITDLDEVVFDDSATPYEYEFSKDISVTCCLSIISWTNKQVHNPPEYDVEGNGGRDEGENCASWVQKMTNNPGCACDGIAILKSNSDDYLADNYNSSKMHPEKVSYNWLVDIEVYGTVSLYFALLNKAGGFKQTRP